jgi:hypothetical protein
MKYTLLVISALLCTRPAAAAPQGPAQAVPATSASIQVLCSVTNRPINEAYCVARVGAPESVYNVITGPHGKATLLGMVPIANSVIAPEDPEANAENPIEVLLEVAAFGYLPFKRTVSLTANTRVMQVMLLPEKFGVVSPMISGVTGGTFELTGLGTLRVPPNALSQDACIRITPIPTWSATHGVLDDHDNVCQFYALAVNNLGQALPGVLSNQPNGVTLAVDIASNLPPDAQDEQWITHALGTSFDQDVTTVTPGDLRRVQRIKSPVCEGHNAVTHTYAVLDLGCNTLWTPWKVERQLLSTDKEVVTTVPFKCGHYMVGKVVGRGNTVAHETSFSLTTSVTEEVGVEVEKTLGSLTSSASHKLSTTIEGTTTEGTITTKTFEEQTNVLPTQHVCGTPAGDPQPPGWGCVSGKVEWGYLTSHYRIWTWRRKVCVGALWYQKKVLGSISICGPFDMWFTDVSWDSSCVGCSQTGQVPPDMPIR